VSIGQVDLSGKKLELLREIAPSLRRAAYLASSTDPHGPRFVDHTRAAGEKMGIEIQPVFVRGADEFEAPSPSSPGVSPRP
jgi:putative tryptophan/tyrosine transport system substrate-binding protein